jgi:hypothetical protein
MQCLVGIQHEPLCDETFMIVQLVVGILRFCHRRFAFGRSASLRETPSRLAILRTTSGFHPTDIWLACRSRPRALHVGNDDPWLLRRRLHGVSSEAERIRA